MHMYELQQVILRVKICSAISSVAADCESDLFIIALEFFVFICILFSFLLNSVNMCGFSFFVCTMFKSWLCFNSHISGSDFFFLQV